MSVDPGCLALARRFLRDYALTPAERAEEVERLAESFQQVAEDACENLPRKETR